MVTRPYEYQKLDGKDRRVLQLVQRDGALSQAEIAKLLARETVRRQLLEAQSVDEVLAIVKKEDGG